jgi:hypothetical protein
MMVRRGDWIYLDGDVEDYGNGTVFRVGSIPPGLFKVFTPPPGFRQPHLCTL